MSKPSLPKGTRDFGPQEVLRRNYIFDTVRSVFVRYGFQPLETPAMESLTTLTGKYGEEGDKLLFKVLNNGDFLAKADTEKLAARDSQGLVSSISKRGLRYDLTVPFARYVVMNQHALSFPFKRYQIQPVWRADRPQKGRYQEFYQCDVDVVGSDALLYEAELVLIYDEVFKQLNIPVVIRMNNRKILAGLAEAVGVKDQFVDMTVAIDKLDKIGLDGVKNELDKRGFSATAITTIGDLLENPSLEAIRPLIADTEIGAKGLAEVDEVLKYLASQKTANSVEVDVTLARGLGYYTGCIFEVDCPSVKIGSIGGGGRYDDLTGNFGLKGVSGVGVSFGAARIYDVMMELDLFPATAKDSLQLLFVAFDDASHAYAFGAVQQARAAGINAELYPTPAKLKKQMKYANDRQVPYVVLIGSEEMTSGQLSLKNMETGEQEKKGLDGIIAQLNNG